MDSWQSLYETCQKLEQDVTKEIQAGKYTSSSNFHRQAQWRSNVQEALGRFTLAVTSLRQKLNTGQHQLTAGERGRREALVSALEGREKQLRFTFQEGGFQGDVKRRREEADRKRLLDSNIVDLGTDDSWDNNESTALLPDGAGSMTLYKERREAALADQDAGLDALHEVIVRQKRIAENIETEVGAQNDLIDDIDDGLDRVNQRLVTTTQGVRDVGRRDSVWRYWLVIVILTILIIVIIAIPGKS